MPKFSKQVLNRWYYSFAIQLLVMHIKKNQVLVLYWLILLGFVTQTLGNRFGIPYLFLDPEYAGIVNGRAFLIMGLGVGAFIMAFNISSYILNSFRFPFLACLSKTFQKYTLNNFILPTTFLVIYVIKIFHFQYVSQLKPVSEILVNIACFLIGVTAIIYSTWKYFLITNKDIYKLFGIEDAESENYEKHRALYKKQNGRAKSKKFGSRNWRVETYISLPLKTTLVRDTSHYQSHMLQSVFKQNHINAAVVELVVFAIFIVLGLFRDYSFFRIPAGASILLLFTMIIMLSGVFRFWLRAWANTAIVGVFLLLNFLSQFETFNPSNKAYGLNYKTVRPEYNLNSIEKFYTDSIIKQDKAQTLLSLENWKKHSTGFGEEKPKMILLAVSGGGLRSALFTFRSMQVIDSILNGQLMTKTKIICGSSGGLIGASYYRALFMESKNHPSPSNISYSENISDDILNAVSFSFTVSDLFLNMQSFNDGNYRYVKDRAYAFEKQLNENTGQLLDKRIRDYFMPELKAEIPQLIISPTIINDGRTVIISSLPASYLLQDYRKNKNDFYSTPDGIEFSHFFENEDALNLKFTSALRLNATFPYIMPAASLPSSPPIEVMDAGIRDNFGIINSLRFLFAFKEWIHDNTSGVVLIQLRDSYKRTQKEESGKNTFIEKLTSPLKNVTGNFLLMHDYNNDNALLTAKVWMTAPLDVVQLEIPEMDEKISLSWHLTEKEKQFIMNSVLNTSNVRSLSKLASVLKMKPLVAEKKPHD